MQLQHHVIRDWRFEFLRIVAMLLIVTTHFLYAGSLVIPLPARSLSSAFHNALQMSGQIGVTLFVLISAYFLTTSKQNNYRRIVNLWIQVFFYSCFGFVSFLFCTRVMRISCIDYQAVSLRMIATTLLPIVFNEYWFITAFVVLMLLAPYVNILLNALNKRQTSSLIMLNIAVTFLWKFANPSIQYFTDVSYLLALYLIGSYIRRYHETIMRISIIQALSVSVSCFALCVLGNYAIEHGITPTRQLQYPGNLFTAGPGASPILSVIVASVWFLYFVQHVTQHSPTLSKTGDAIRILAPATFGVYLIHEHYLLKPLIWAIVFRTPVFHNGMLVTIIMSLLLIVLTYCALLTLSWLLHYCIIKHLTHLVEQSVKRLETCD